LLLTSAFYIGLRTIRQVALQIAQENHDAIAAMDSAAEALQKKREANADAAAASAYAKVQPILATSSSSSIEQQKAQKSLNDTV
jgi:hypothetical protein